MVICGRAGTGKTTLARRLAQAIPCPCISRDEIKEGMVHATPNSVAEPGDALTQRASPLFFDVVRLLTSAGVSLIAEAAFTHPVWEAQLQSLYPVANLRIVRCRTDSATRLERVAQRGMRPAHADGPPGAEVNRNGVVEEFRYLSIQAPTLDVDTTSEYRPSIRKIIAFVNAPQENPSPG